MVWHHPQWGGLTWSCKEHRPQSGDHSQRKQWKPGYLAIGRVTVLTLKSHPGGCRMDGLFHHVTSKLTGNG